MWPYKEWYSGFLRREGRAFPESLSLFLFLLGVGCYCSCWSKYCYPEATFWGRKHQQHAHTARLPQNGQQSLHRMACSITGIRLRLGAAARLGQVAAGQLFILFLLFFLSLLFLSFLLFSRVLFFLSIVFPSLLFLSIVFPSLFFSFYCFPESFSFFLLFLMSLSFVGSHWRSSSG